MKTFTHINARSVDEAVDLLRRYRRKANALAGGTDLIGKMKDRVLPGYPEAVVNLKTIPGLDFIREDNGGLKIGALTRLHDIAEHGVVRSRYRALAMAAGRTASPNLRHMGTIGGNICQDIRCWYYRCANNRFPCLRKGGGRCYAIQGDSRYHSIFGGSVKEGCFAVHPGDTAPALIALDAEIITTGRIVRAEDFFAVRVGGATVLDHDEIVTEIRIPSPADNAGSSFMKFAIRKSIDFPIVNCAAMIAESGGRVEFARICLNGVYVMPYRAVKSEQIIVGNTLDPDTLKAAGDAVMAAATPLKDNGYMVTLAGSLVKKTILACQEKTAGR